MVNTTLPMCLPDSKRLCASEIYLIGRIESIIGFTILDLFELPPLEEGISFATLISAFLTESRLKILKHLEGMTLILFYVQIFQSMNLLCD